MTRRPLKRTSYLHLLRVAGAPGMLLVLIAGAACTSAATPRPVPTPYAYGRGYTRPGTDLLLLPKATTSYLASAVAHGNQVAFSAEIGDGRHSDGVFVGSVKNWHPKRISYDYDPGYIWSSARWLVWSTDYFGPAKAFAYNWHTGKVRVIYNRKFDRAPRTGGEVIGPASGNNAIWQYSECVGKCANRAAGIDPENDSPPKAKWRSVLALIHVPDGKRRIIASAPEPCSLGGASLSGHVVVWEQFATAKPGCGGAIGDDVMMYDLRTGKTTQLTNDHISGLGVTNGRYVAWVSEHSTDTWNKGAPITLLNLRTGIRKPASYIPRGKYIRDPDSRGLRWLIQHHELRFWYSRHRLLETSISPPIFLSTRLLTWEDPRNDMDLAYDLRTGRTYVLGQSAGKWGPDVPGQPFARRAAWKETRLVCCKGLYQTMIATTVVP